MSCHWEWLRNVKRVLAHIKKKKQNVGFSTFIILKWLALLCAIYLLKYLILANQDEHWKSAILILFEEKWVEQEIRESLV